MRNECHEGGKLARRARQWPVVRLTLATQILKESVCLIKHFERNRLAQTMFVPARGANQIQMQARVIA